MIIDAHLHADARPVENFKDMNIAGVEAIVTCAYDSLAMKQSNVCFEHFDKIVFDEAKRVEPHNIKLYSAVGIHPRAIPQDYMNVLKHLEDYLKYEHVIAIGEIGLETISDLEQEVFIKQLKYADENNYRVIVHTPRTNKAEVTETISKLLDENIKPELVQLDHIDFSIIDLVIDKGYNLGITVQPLKMSVNDTVKMLDEYGFEKFVLDSDMSPAPSNHMSLPETKHELTVEGYKKSDIDKVMFKNVSKFHKLKL